MIPTASSADELTRREALSYPPYASLIRVICSAPEERLAREAAGALHAELAGLDAAVLGPAPLFRLRGRWRQQLVIKAIATPAGDRRRRAGG